MKKVILFFAVAISSVLMMAQTNQVTWVNGRAVLGQSISSIDSIKYGTIVKSQKLELWLPETIIVHDTIHDIIHDTIYRSVRDKAPEDVEMVDLGLPSGIKWANMNVGAATPEGYGDYFAWGETEPKDVYDWSTYKWCSNGDWTGMTKYTYPDGQKDGIWYDGDTFIGDNKTTLDPEDDAAHVNWGGSWRMPTKAEQDELRNNCTWTWTQKNGINGYEVKGTNGNTIFLPASGCRGGSSLYDVGSIGDYWSSSLNEDYSSLACRLVFSSGSVGWSNDYRGSGHSVRPVCQ